MDILDLTKINEPANSGVWVDIKHPQTGKKLPIRFKILGSSSDKFYKLRDELQTEKFASAMDGKEVNSDEFGLRLVAGMVTDVEGLEKDGAPLKDAIAIFKTDGLRFIFQQLDIEINKKANFTKPESAS